MRETVAIYPGSFNPWHIGHDDILYKALRVFDRVIVAQGQNPEKEPPRPITETGVLVSTRVTVTTFDGLLPEFVKKHSASAVIRGLRNGHDLQHEQNQQYWYEDLGLTVPIVYFVCDRQHAHISSSTMRALERYGVEHGAV